MKALILAPFDPASLERLRRSVEVTYESWQETRTLLAPEELVARIQDGDHQIVVIEADFIFDEVFDQADKLRFVGICRGAVDHVDIEAATAHHVLVVNTPARNASAVAELSLGLMLSLARHIPQAHSLVSSGQWVDPVGPYISLRGVELSGKVAGIVGLGAIGRELARRLRAFDMTVLAHDPFVTASQTAELGVELVGLNSLMSRSDFISIHCPLSAETTGLIGRKEIQSMKPSAYIVNTAGWEIIDEKALLEALERKRIAGAAFDVYETHPVSGDCALLRLDNVVLTPHIGGATDGTVQRYSAVMTDEIERFVAGQRPSNLVNAEAWRPDGR